MNAVEKPEKNSFNIDDLPALPGIAIRILEETRNPETPLKKLADTLSTDPPLSAKVLNVVNSPFFGLSRQITNLPHAVNLLGEESLKYIALSFSLVSLFRGDKTDFDYSGFWRDSLACAVICRLVSRALGQSDAEDMYFLGLIHNIGILAMVQSRPGPYGMVVKKARADNVAVHITENEILGCNHMEVGARLIEAWGLPEIFFLPVRHHHYPENISAAPENEQIRTKIVHLADEICHFLHSGEKALNLAMVHQRIKDYGMDEKIDLETIAGQACRQLEPLLPLFDIKGHSSMDYAQILEDSKKEMYRLSFDLTKKIRKQQQVIDNLSVLASQDGLTGLKNYKSFKENLARELASTRRYGYTSVLGVADLDAFKALNDKYGHVAGDHVLKEISRFFMKSTRASDVVFRCGGEEFAFILPRTRLKEGYRSLDRLRRNLANLEIEYQGEILSVTMSVGVTAIFPTSDLSETDFLRQADKAMYSAKNEGKNRTFIFSPER